jgi:hypothetical protein
MSLIFNTFQALIGTLTGRVLNDIHGASNVKRGSSLTARCRLAVPEKGFSRGAGREHRVIASWRTCRSRPASGSLGAVDMDLTHIVIDEVLSEVNYLESIVLRTSDPPATPATTLRPFEASRSRGYDA